MISGIILLYQTLTGCKLEYLPTDSPEEPNIINSETLRTLTTGGRGREELFFQEG